MAENTPKIEDMSFKEASVELERIVRSIESGDLELEEALKNFERGQALLASLNERLSSAEQKVQVLMDASDAQESFDSTAAPAEEFLDE